MYNLRIFIVYNSHGQGDYQNKLLGFEDLESFPTELTCFSWERYPFKSLPPNFQAENLVVLHMPCSKIEKLWNGVQNLVKLKRVDLSWSRHLIEVPNLSKAVNLQELILRDCKSLISLPEGIQSKLITLQGCTMLIMVPKISCKVEHLDLSGTAIRQLPFFEQPSKLVTLNLSNCSRLENLSTSIGKSKYLEYLYLQQWSRPGRLPDDFGNLDTSEALTSHGISKAMSSITKRIRYPEPMNCTLNCLSSFVKRCLLADWQIPKLPIDLGQLSFLKELNLSGNNFECMPASMKDLSNLCVLNISNCERLIVLPELRRDINLAASNCYSLESISNSSFLFSHGLRIGSVNFANCFRLNLSKYLHKKISREFCKGICYPGNEIPEWFEFQNIGSCITLELPPDWTKESLLGFNTCGVVAFPKGYKLGYHQLSCFFIVKSKNHETEVYKCHLDAGPFFLYGLDHIGSDHVLVGFVDHMENIIRMRSSRDEVSQSKSKVSFLSYASDGVEIKKCGIHFLYESDCSSFMISNKEEEEEDEQLASPWLYPFNMMTVTVKDILGGFNKLCPTDDNKDPVEIEIAVQKIESLFRIESDGVLQAQISSLGPQISDVKDRETVAQVLYDKISTEFEVSFFFRSGSRRYIPRHLRNEFLSKLLDEENTNIEYCLKHKRVLLIFDHFWDPEEIQDLFRDLTCLSSRSRSIMPSIDQRLLRSEGYSYKVMFCGLRCEVLNYYIDLSYQRHVSNLV